MPLTSALLYLSIAHSTCVIQGADRATPSANSSAAGRRSTYRKKYLLAIGIDKYFSGGFKPLSCAVADALEVSQVLTSRYGFEAIQEPLLDQDATKTGIETALSNLADSTKIKPEDCVVIYYAGHGDIQTLPDSSTQSFIVPFNRSMPSQLSQTTYMSKFLRLKDVWTFLETCPSKHVLVLCDSCFSGDLVSDRSKLTLSSQAISTLLSEPSREVITGSIKGKIVQEDPTIGHGYFTNELLRELRRRADEKEPFIAVALYNSVLTAVGAATGGNQTPNYGSLKSGKFVFFPNDSKIEDGKPAITVSARSRSKEVSNPNSNPDITFSSLTSTEKLFVSQVDSIDKDLTYTSKQTGSTNFIVKFERKQGDVAKPINVSGLEGISYSNLKGVHISAGDGVATIEFETKNPAVFRFTGQRLYIRDPLSTGQTSLNSNSASNNIAPFIVLDAGHGGQDTGGKSGNYLEKDFALDIAKRTGALLKQKGIRVVYTRSNDSFISLINRPILANQPRAQALISIHVNSAKVNMLPYNCLIGYYHGGSAEDQLFSRSLIDSCTEMGGIVPIVRSDSKVFMSGFSVLRNSKCPAVQLELGNINDPNSIKLIWNDDFKQRYANAIANGVKRYLRGTNIRKYFIAAGQPL